MGLGVIIGMCKATVFISIICIIVSSMQWAENLSARLRVMNFLI